MICFSRCLFRACVLGSSPCPSQFKVLCTADAPNFNDQLVVKPTVTWVCCVVGTERQDWMGN